MTKRKVFFILDEDEVKKAITDAQVENAKVKEKIPKIDEEIINPGRNYKELLRDAQMLHPKEYIKRTSHADLQKEVKYKGINYFNRSPNRPIMIPIDDELEDDILST
jgi:hypothetical protein